MGVIIKGNKLVIGTKPKTIHFDLLPKDFGINLKHAIDFVMNQNEFLSEHAIKNEIS